MISIEDRLQIEELAARYNLAVDLGDPGGWVSCFLPDGELVINQAGPWMAATHQIRPGVWRGESELSAFAAQVTSGPRVRHWSHNRVLVDAGSGIDATSYMNVYYLDAPPEHRLATGVMRDHIRRSRPDGPWRFASRRISFDR